MTLWPNKFQFKCKRRGGFFSVKTKPPPKNSNSFWTDVRTYVVLCVLCTMCVFLQLILNTHFARVIPYFWSVIKIYFHASQWAKTREKFHFGRTMHCLVFASKTKINVFWKNFERSGPKGASGVKKKFQTMLILVFEVIVQPHGNIFWHFQVRPKSWKSDIV